MITTTKEVMLYERMQLPTSENAVLSRFQIASWRYRRIDELFNGRAICPRDA